MSNKSPVGPTMSMLGNFIPKPQNTNFFGAMRKYGDTVENRMSKLSLAPVADGNGIGDTY